ncbi:hypothetical protein GQ457_18G012400 [Hibiscus cannabinus]
MDEFSYELDYAGESWDFGRGTSHVYYHYIFIKLHEGVFAQYSRNFVSNCIYYTCDGWFFACNSRSYFALTAYYVDNNWKLQYKILNSHRFPHPMMYLTSNLYLSNVGFCSAINILLKRKRGTMPTSLLSNVVGIEKLLCDAHNDPCEGISTMTEYMLELYEKYWFDHSTNLSFVVLFDHRYNLQLLKELYNVLYIEDEVEMRNFDDNLTASRSGKSDVDSYMNFPLLPRIEDSEFDILEYWRAQTISFVVIPHMARDVLAISITSATSKSSFIIGV